MNPDSKIKTGNRENRSLREKVTIDEHKNMPSPIKFSKQMQCCKNPSLGDNREKI